MLSTTCGVSFATFLRQSSGRLGWITIPVVLHGNADLHAGPTDPGRCSGVTRLIAYLTVRPLLALSGPFSRTRLCRLLEQQRTKLNFGAGQFVH
jgi:hypothetical protein